MKLNRAYTLTDKLGFGKEHKEDTIEEIIDTDMGYIQWALGEKVIELTMEAKKYYTQKALESVEKKGKNWRF